MRKAAVRNGDPTTTGGSVIAYSSTIHDNGKKVALSGDEATCGTCKGAHEIFGTGKGMSEKGRNVVIDGDLVLCPCGENRVIVGSNPGIFLKSTEGAASRSNAGSAYGKRPSSASLVFDEQVRATGQGAVEGYPYCVLTSHGRVYSGRLDSDSKLPRINTGAAADQYTIYWGDEALGYGEWK
jgi:uncharacterized Zn-binding protein involved in type VI secretion